jgi:predicted NBD/HSP70 family sugar kinase
VLGLADADEPAPVRVLREVGRTLGRTLADLCTFLNPGALILDGALGGAGRHVLVGLAEQIERYCAPAVAASLTLVPGELGADADIRGAIRLARAEFLAGG